MNLIKFAEDKKVKPSKALISAFEESFFSKTISEFSENSAEVAAESEIGGEVGFLKIIKIVTN